jgi:anti-sigma factor RsiW
MSAARDGIGERELNAVVDGRLPTEHATAVEAYLAANPDQRERIEQDGVVRQQLRQAFAEPIDELIPSRLRISRLQAERRRRTYSRLGAAAAALVLLIVGGLGGWVARNWGLWLPQGNQTAQAAAAEREITNDALAAHRVFSVEVRHPVEVDAAQEAHLVQWLSKRLGRPMVVPDLTAAGFQLMGGRLLPSEGGPAAQFMYQKGNNRLTLYERSDDAGETAFRYSEQNGVGEFYWSDRDFGYALTAKVDRQELLTLAEMIYHQLSDEGAKAKAPPPPPGKAS